VWAQSGELSCFGKCRHKTAPKERNPKKADNIPLHQPVPKPVDFGVTEEFIDFRLEHDVSKFTVLKLCEPLER
jgi:hypothetical protein